MKLIQVFFLEFWELTKEMSPYLLLGFLFAGLLHGYFPSGRIRKYLGSNNLTSSFNAAMLGIPLPLCSCGVIPTGVSFYTNGASRGATVSFLISTPQTGVDSILVTYSLMGLPFAIARPFIALITGVFGGWITSKGTAGEKETRPAVPVKEERKAGDQDGWKRLSGMLRYAFVDFLNDISKWLLIGLLIAALIAVLVPDTFFTDYLENDYLSMLLVLAVSVPMYVCATGSVPIAAVLLAKGLSPGAAIVFLMAGPATNAATIMVIGKSMGRRTLAMYLSAIIGGALFFGILINELPFLRTYFSGMAAGEHLHSHLIPEWLETGAAILLGILMLNGYIKRKITTMKTKNMGSTAEEQQVNIGVSGMTCGHCTNSVETNLVKLEGIESVKADLERQQVTIKGNKIDLEKVGSVIQQLGYEYKGKK